MSKEKRFTKDDLIEAYQEGFSDGAGYAHAAWKHPPETIAFLTTDTFNKICTRTKEHDEFIKGWGALDCSNSGEYIVPSWEDIL
jgi:hypothetical protein